MRRNSVSWHDGSWRFSKTLDGKRRYFYAPVSIGPKERAKAERWMHETLRSIESDRLSLDRLTVAALSEKFLAWMTGRVERGEAAPLTLAARQAEARAFLPVLGAKVAGTLTLADTDALVTAWAGKSPTTIRNRLIGFKAVIRWGVKRGLIPADPIPEVELPAIPYRGERYAEATEVEAFLTWLDLWAARQNPRQARFARLQSLVIRLIAETGCRPCEAAALRWEHWQADTRAFVLDQHKTARRKGRPRLIVCGSELSGRIESLRTGPDADREWVFVRSITRHASGKPVAPEEKERGVPWDAKNLGYRLRTLRRRAKIEGVDVSDQGIQRFHLYRLRHSAITSQIQAGRNIADVAALAGNSVRVIESTYLHVQLAHLRRVVDGG